MACIFYKMPYVFLRVRIWLYMQNESVCGCAEKNFKKWVIHLFLSYRTTEE